MTIATGRPKGGYRPGAGRKLSPLKSIKLTQELLERGKLILGDSAAPSPLDFALQLMWDQSNSLDVRIDAMKTAIPYCSPKLQAITVSNPDENRLIVEFIDFRRQQAIGDGGSMLVSRPNPAVDVAINDLVEEQDENDPV